MSVEDPRDVLRMGWMGGRTQERWRGEEARTCGGQEDGWVDGDIGIRFVRRIRSPVGHRGTGRLIDG